MVVGGALYTRNPPEQPMLVPYRETTTTMPDITFIHTADEHFDTDTHGSINPATGLNRAWESNADATASAVEAALEHQVDAFVSSGDMFKNGRPSQEALLLAAETLRPLVDAGIPLVLLGGNHERLQVPTSQRTATDTLGEILTPHGEVHVVERSPRLVRLDSGIQVAALPWLSKTTVLSKLGIEQDDPVHGDRAVVQFALDSLEQMCDEADTTAPFILASHVTVDDVRLDNVAKGHKRGSEVDIAHLFAEPILPRMALQDSPVSYAALGHIHARQRIGTKCFYSGSPNRFTFTDADDEKSVNLVTISDRNELVSVEHVQTRARLMHRIVLDSAEASDQLAALSEGALIETVLPVGEGVLPDDIRAQIVEAGASIVSVKSTPAEVSSSSAIVLPETVTPVQALKTWLGEKHPDVDQAGLVAAAAGLMEEVTA